MKHGGWRLALASFTGLVLLTAAVLLMGTSFMIHDDEGYLLQTYRHFNAGKILYDEIFTQYGPFPYVYHWLVNLIFGEATHATGRALTIFHWVLCSLLTGALTLSLTRNLLAGTTSCLLAFGLLWQMTWEPGHPGGLIAVVVAAACTIAMVACLRHQWALLTCTLGTGAALLLLTKINVGLLFVAGAGSLALRHTNYPERWQKPAAILTWIGMLALPWVLMMARLDHPAVMAFAAQFTLSAAALLWIAPHRLCEKLIQPRAWLHGMLCFFGVLALVCAIVLWHGTSPSALLKTVLIDPLRMPGYFMTTLRWPPMIWPLAGACMLLVARAGWELRTCGCLTSVTRMTTICIRLITLGVFSLNMVTWVTVHGPAGVLVWSLPLLPVFMIPVSPSAGAPSSATRLPILMLACLLLPQILHAFPVAGSQIGWSVFMLPVFFMTGLLDAAYAIISSYIHGRKRIMHLFMVLPLTVAICQIALLLKTGWDRHLTSIPLGLPGAEHIRLDGRTRLALRTMSLNSSIHTDLLFSRPGMFSFNLWSHVDTPTLKNATQWSWLLRENEQFDIIERLKSTPRTAIISSRSLDTFMTANKIPVSGPLAEHVRSHYRPLFSSGDFTFHVPIGSGAVPFGIAEIFVASPPGPPETTPAYIQAYVALDAPPAGARLQALEYPGRELETYSIDNTDITLLPITSEGRPIAPPFTLPHPHPVRGLYQLKIHTTLSRTTRASADSTLVLFDHNGEIIAEAGFEPVNDAGQPAID